MGQGGNSDALNLLHDKRIAFACKKGHKPEAPNQDSFFVIRAGNDLSLYGVFDGHGPCGHDVSYL